MASFVLSHAVVYSSMLFSYNSINDIQEANQQTYLQTFMSSLITRIRPRVKNSLSFLVSFV